MNTAQWKLELDLPADRVTALEDALCALQPEDQPPGFAHFEADDAGTVWRFAAYLLPAPPPNAITRLLTDLGLAVDAADYAPVPDRDWVAESLRLLAPVRAGRFFVHGRHDAGKVPPDALAIEVEAAQAFGSGNHATTQGCLVALSDLKDAGHAVRTALDLGCGSGILAIAIARLWPDARIIAADNDPIAVAITADNAEINQVTLDCHVSEGMAAAELTRSAPYDLIAANILMQPLIELAPDLAAALGRPGRLVLSGLLETQQAAVEAAYRHEGVVLERAIVREGWATLIMRQP